MFWCDCHCCRSKLFKLINQYPTLFEVVTGRVQNVVGTKPQTAAAPAGGNKPAQGNKRKQEGGMVSPAVVKQLGQQTVAMQQSP